MAVLKYKDPYTGEVKVVSSGGGGINTGGHNIGDICCSTKDDLGSSWKLTNGETTIFKNRSPELIKILNKNDEWGSKIISFNNSTTTHVQTTKIIYCENKLVALLSNCHICVASEPGDDWIDLGDIRSSEFGVIFDIAYHNGVWVAVGEIDDDGNSNYNEVPCVWVTNNLNSSWTLIRLTTSSAWAGLRKIFYFNNMWIATSYNNSERENFYISTDPFNTWTGPINPNFSNSHLILSDLTYKNNKWIGIGIVYGNNYNLDNCPYVVTTTDIINGPWTEYQISSYELNDNLSNLLYHNGTWVVGATQSSNAHFCLFYTSDITTEWTRYDVTDNGKIDSDFRLHDICYYNNKWTVCGYYSRGMLPCAILTASELTDVWTSLGSFSSETSPLRVWSFNCSWL